MHGGRDWRLIDTAIDSHIYDTEKHLKIKEKDELDWAEILTQGTATLEVAPFEHLLSLRDTDAYFRFRNGTSRKHAVKGLNYT